ncbi:MAG: segregation/condensation protein A [Pseudomonadota bacterium]|uniref:Segregation and condensation protein A n=1 Tax=Metallibacterium scheffleri TaxID=993689 RepID=A0A4S3KHB8_9GAMM|nr:segregation/condensation protein A [Pseudomonadota bacterium]THD08092.1 segregation/condensation protein A [Metallibacterium scheffleri]
MSTEPAVAGSADAPQGPFKPVPQQQEMPLALVRGQPMLSMPQDLYIPPDALEVILEAFEGPLDLLLYLIRRQNLDVLDIPIAEITRQYMDYIGLMHAMRLELAAEYLVMAAILAEIKSRLLLPRPPDDAAGGESDPRAELVRRLQEYERYKRAAEDLDALPRVERDTSVAHADAGERSVTRVPPAVDLRELLLALKDVLRRAELGGAVAMQRDALSIRERMSDLLRLIEDGAFHAFTEVFKPEQGRLGIVVSFIAMLELIKEGLLDVIQDQPLAPIYLKACSAAV